MKRTYRNGIASIAILSMLMGIPKVAIAYSSSDKEKYKDEKCSLRYRKDPVQENKKWTIKFDKELDSDTVNNNNIMIKDEDDREIGADVSLDRDDKDKKTVFVKPYNRCRQGKKYYIIIAEKVKSKKGKILTKPVKMYFYIRNAFAGLPYEDGLIVVKDIAYSVDYLATNAKLKNEILNDSYNVYYCYQATEQKIKNIFGNIDMNKDDIYKHYDKMTYVGPHGEKRYYEWNDEEMQYKLPEPVVKTEITVNSSAKVMMVDVKSVKGLDGAVYYRLGHNTGMKSIGEKSVFSSKNLREPISIYNYNKNLIAIGVLNTHYANERETKLKIIDDNYKGNVIGNINNNGYAAEDAEGYVFYNNTGDGNKLYKFDLNGVFNNAIANDNAQYINVVDDWVFYSNYSDKGKLYRVKKDGTGRRKLCDDMASYINVCRDWIYYCNHSDGGRIYKIKPDGSCRSRLNSSVSHETAYLNVFGNWIYFTDVNDNHRPYVIDTDGTYIAKLTDEWADSMQVVGEWIYYTSSSGVLSKVKKDGSGQIIPIKGQARQFDKGFHLNVCGNWIFYSNYLDGGKLYKIRTDGSGDNKKLINDTVDYINIAGGYIYYTSRGRLFRVPVDTDGTLKPEQIGRNNGQHRIIQMDDLTVTVSFSDVNMKIEDIEDKYLPKKVPGIMDDNTMHQFPVQWDRNNVSIQNGVRVYNGDVIGYNRRVRLNLIIPSEMLNETNNVKIYNNNGRNSDVVVVENQYDNNLNAYPAKLNVGDIVSVYDDRDCRRLLGRATVTREGTYNRAKIERIELDEFGSRSAWITVIRRGRVESRPTEIKHGDVPSITRVEDKDDERYFRFYQRGLGLGVDGRDFSITNWVPSQVMGDSRYSVYILPQGGKLDTSKNDSRSLDTLRRGESTWTGNRDLRLDSKDVPFRRGKYNMFIVGQFTGTASEDNRGRKPRVSGYASSNPGIIDVKEEVLPRQIGLRSTGSVHRNTSIVLNRAPSTEEQVWLIPINTDRVLMQKVERWLSQENVEWPIDELRRVATCLQGDGVRNSINAPAGIDSNRADYKDVEYKLLVVNKTGSGGFSREYVTVDNKAPEMTDGVGERLVIPNKKPEESFQIKVIDKGNTNNTVNDRIDVYIVQMEADGYTREQLDRAVRERAGKVYSIAKGVPFTCTLRDLKAATRHQYETYYQPRHLNNYKVLAVDKAGNVSNITWFNVIVDTDKLNRLIDKSKYAVEELAVLNEDQERTLQPILTRAEDILRNAATKSQSDIDIMAEQLEGTMERVGIPGDNASPERIVRAIANGLYLKQNRTYLRDRSFVTSNIELDTQTRLDPNIRINWSSSDPTVISPAGIVNQGVANQNVTLTAVITHTRSGAIQQKQFTLTVGRVDIAGQIVSAAFENGNMHVQFTRARDESSVEFYKIFISKIQLSENNVNRATGGNDIRIDTGNRFRNNVDLSQDYQGNAFASGTYYIYIASFSQNDRDPVVLSPYRTVIIRNEDLLGGAASSSSPVRAASERVEASLRRLAPTLNNGRRLIDGDMVNENLNLPTRDDNDSNIRIDWLSSNPEIISVNGTVTPPIDVSAEDTKNLYNSSINQVVLTATITYKNVPDVREKKRFKVSVKSIDSNELKSFIKNIKYDNDNRKLEIEFNKAQKDELIKGYNVIVFRGTDNKEVAKYKEDSCGKFNYNISDKFKDGEYYVRIESITENIKILSKPSNRIDIKNIVKEEVKSDSNKKNNDREEMITNKKDKDTKIQEKNNFDGMKYNDGLDNESVKKNKIINKEPVSQSKQEQKVPVVPEKTPVPTTPIQSQPEQKVESKIITV